MSLLLLDSASLYWRAFHALPDSITAPNGMPINAVRGLLDTIAALAHDRHPDRVIACWDNDWRPQWRVEAVASYKANRLADEDDPATSGHDGAAEEVPDLLGPQIPVIRALLPTLGISVHGADGWEADDVIARLAMSVSSNGLLADVASGDRDLVQLVDPQTTLLYTGGTAKSRGGAPWLTYTPKAVIERFGVRPDQYALMASLRGDPSDGLPGIKGIGERTAVVLVTAFNDLTGLLHAAQHAPTIKPMTPRLAQALLDDWPALQAAYSVTYLRGDTPIADPPPVGTPDLIAARQLAQQWGLERSVERVIAAMAQTSTG